MRRYAGLYVFCAVLTFVCSGASLAADGAAEADCVDRLAECEALERACCEAGEKLGIDWEPDFGGTGDL